jgi:capsular exopolysaccharide synthesis family protein
MTPTQKKNEMVSEDRGQRGSYQTGDNSAPPSGQIDVLKLDWRNKALLILGLIAGLGWGYYKHIQAPISYISSANIQIVEPVANVFPIDGPDSRRDRRSLTDEAEVMRSEGLLKRAAELGALTETPQFSGWNAESIAVSLASGLRISPAGAGGPSNSIFQISYQCGDPVSTQRVVQSVVDAYAEHLQMQYSSVGKETVDLIQSARNEVLERLETLEREFDTFRRASPLVIRDGRTASIHRDNADNFLAQKQSLLVRKMQLETTLRIATDSIAAKEPIEAVLMALNGSMLVTANDPTAAATAIEDRASAAKINQINRESALLPSEQMRESRLLPLEIEYNNLLEQFGASHPAVRSLKTQVDLVRGSVERLAKSEAEYQARMQEVIASTVTSSEQENADPTAAIRRSLEIRLLALSQQLTAVEQEIAVFDKAYKDEMTIAKSENSAEMEVARFNREIERQQGLYDRIVARLDEINIVAEAGALKVFPLQSPKRGGQITPPISKSLATGGFLGLLLAGALAYLKEVSDKSYRSAEQIAEHLRMPVIGHVPVVKMETKLAKASDSGMDASLISFYRPKCQTSEAFKGLRTALYFSNRSFDYKVLQVTSPTPGDGKSTVAANLAISMAQSGKSVILIDSDLRRPRVQKLFGIENEKGLAWLLAQLPKNPSPEQVKELLGEVIVESSSDNLSIIGAGSRPDNPSELLSSSQFDAVMSVLKELFDLVMIDSPPLLAVTDPSTLASRVDGVLLVVRLKKNAKPAAARASRMLETLEANVIGVVVNGVGSRAAKGYGKYADADGYYNRGRYYQYGYGYSYGSYSYGKYDEYYSDKDGKKKTRKEVVGS